MANARLDDPGALGGVLTGVSFIGGLATGLSLADAPSPAPAPTSRTSSGSSRAMPDPSGSTWAVSSSGRLPGRVLGLGGAARRPRGPGIQDASGHGHRGWRAGQRLPGRLSNGRGCPHCRSWPGRGPGQVAAPPPVRRGRAGTWRRAGVAAGSAGAGRAAHRALPRPLATAALASAGVDALAPVVLAVPKAALVVPAGRFPTFVVLGISGVRLARGAQAG